MHLFEKYAHYSKIDCRYAGFGLLLAKKVDKGTEGDCFGIFVAVIAMFDGLARYLVLEFAVSFLQNSSIVCLIHPNICSKKISPKVIRADFLFGFQQNFTLYHRVFHKRWVKAATLCLFFGSPLCDYVPRIICLRGG